MKPFTFFSYSALLSHAKKAQKGPDGDIPSGPLTQQSNVQAFWFARVLRDFLAPKARFGPTKRGGH
jgi:hypothetical protein